MGASGAIQALYMKVLMQRNFVAEFQQSAAQFLCVKCMTCLCWYHVTLHDQKGWVWIYTSAASIHHHSHSSVKQVWCLHNALRNDTCIACAFTRHSLFTDTILHISADRHLSRDWYVEWLGSLWKPTLKRRCISWRQYSPACLATLFAIMLQHRYITDRLLWRCFLVVTVCHLLSSVETHNLIMIYIILNAILMWMSPVNYCHIGQA